jgi:hypothetical protein
MTQYLVAIHLPDNFDPSARDKEVESDFDALSEEMEASGVKDVFAGGLSPATERSRCERSPMARCLSPTGHTWRPRST